MEKTSQTASNIGHILAQWETPEYMEHEKGQSWYLIAGLSVLAVIVYGLIFADYTMSIAFALLAAVYYVVHSQEPKNIVITITTLGIVVENQFYQFSDIENFWIVYNGSNIKVLYLRFVKRFAADVRIELMDQDPMTIKNILKTQIREISGRGETLVDRIARFFKL